LGQLLQHSFEGFIGLDSEQQIVYFSPGAQEMYGYLPREVLGRPVSILDDPSGVSIPSTPAIDAASRSVFECTRRHASGQLLRILVARSPVRTSSALEPGYACVEVSLDVTQARDMEKQMAQQAKLAHLGRIAATMSHEINNPLAVIQSCGLWLEQYSSTCDTPDLTEVASDLMIAVERISSFVKQITGFVRESPVNITSTPLSQTLELAFRMVRARAANKNVSIKFGDTVAADEAVGHDPSRLSHAIINILANAVDAAADGGRNVWVSAKHEQNGVILNVEDDGPGVAPEIADRLFEPFATTKAFGHGTGLGLPLTREVVLQHGGSISLLPRESGGTLARLELPRSGKGRP
jgi:PAS domain S-box-containing protein